MCIKFEGVCRTKHKSKYVIVIINTIDIDTYKNEIICIQLSSILKKKKNCYMLDKLELKVTKLEKEW
jgi:hypothetical protein